MRNLRDSSMACLPTRDPMGEMSFDYWRFFAYLATLDLTWTGIATPKTQLGIPYLRLPLVMLKKNFVPCGMEI